MGSPMTLSDMTLSDLERSMSMSLRFQSIISFRVAELGQMLLLSINKKPYTGSTVVLLQLILYRPNKRSMPMSLRFRGLNLIKEMS